MTFTVNNSRKSLPEKYWHKVLSVKHSRNGSDLILGLNFQPHILYSFKLIIIIIIKKTIDELSNTC